MFAVLTSLLLLILTSDVRGAVLFITGGVGPVGVDISSTEVLDLTNSTCSRTLSLGGLPDQRYGHSMVSLEDGSLVVCGGYTELKKGTSAASVKNSQLV